MSHHYSGPDYGFPHGDARLDLTDLYAFPKPDDPSKSILVMNVHPSSSVNPPGLTTAVPFASEAIYELKIDFAHSLEHSGGYAPEAAARAARALLPDVLAYDPRLPASYPTNGRALSDDVMDVFVAILSNGRVTRDGVGPHGDLLSVFPYLGPPHQDRTAELASP